MASDTVYRIYTEDADRDRVIEVVSRQWESFTLHETTGYYKGKAERSLVIEIVDAEEETVEVAARAIRAINEQKTVLVMSLKGQARKII
jgi:hypothetical protein